MKLDYDKMINSNGNHLTQSLFYEFRHQTKSDYMPFTLKERDFKGCISVYRVYMDSDTEYEAAIKLLGSWKHWNILCEAPFFAKELAKWREERDIREAAEAKVTLLEQAREGNVTAAKAILEGQKKRKAGRPTKDEVEGEKKKQAAIDTKVSSIIDRMAKF